MVSPSMRMKRQIVPEPFSYMVGDVPETWGQEAVVFHNPNALFPISQNFFDPLCQYWLIDNRFHYTVPAFYPFFSVTQVFCGKVERMPSIEDTVREAGRQWSLKALQRIPELRMPTRNSRS
jgi:hypothetical protein